MRNHEYFEELCALAATGQVSHQEIAELVSHLRECSDCERAYADFADIVYTKMPLVEADRLSLPDLRAFFTRDNRYWDRFVTGTRALGFEFSTEPSRQRWRGRTGLSYVFQSLYRPASAVLAVGLLLALALSFLSWRERATENATALAQLGRENAALLRELKDLSLIQSSLEDGLLAARKEISAHSVREDSWSRRYAELEAEWRQTIAELATANEAQSRIQAELRDVRGDLRSAETEARELKKARMRDASVLVAQEAQIVSLTNQLQEKSRIVEREMQLLVADRDIRDLMGARNLHIIDVYDVDGRGENRRSFGRVFYTEGKSLVFYAYDLDQADFSEAKYSFQAWGERESSSAAAVNLGLFYVDSAEQRRWILKFDDPDVMRKIDALFVTVEPFGGRERPSGKRLLVASLGHQPNHP